MWGEDRKSQLVLTVAGAALLMGGCPTDVVDDDDTTDGGDGITFAGRLVDADRGDGLDGCLVGETFDAAATSGADGSFSLQLSAAGATVHVACDGGVLRSFRLPEGPAAFNWEVPVDMGTGPDLGVECGPNISGDAEPVGVAAGEGSMELRLLTDSSTGSWDTTLPSQGWTIQVGGFLRVPQGPYLVIAKAHGGSIPGFAVSDTLTCDGNGSSPATDLDLAPVPTTSLSGTWSPAAGSSYFFAASSPLAGVDAKFQWYEYDVVHTATADATSFQLELLEGIGTGDPTVAACQSATDGRRTCKFRQGVTDGEDLGGMPEFVSMSASMNGGDMRVTPIGTITEGSAELFLTDDLGNPVWTGWTPGGGSDFEIDVPEEWLTDLPNAAGLYGFGRGVRDVTFDFGSGFDYTSTPDGWSLFRMPSEPAFF